MGSRGMKKDITAMSVGQEVNTRVETSMEETRATEKREATKTDAGTEDSNTIILGKMQKVVTSHIIGVGMIGVITRNESLKENGSTRVKSILIPTIVCTT